MAGYRIEQRNMAGEFVVLGAPFPDLLVAKVIASRRALQMQLFTVVRDECTGEEISRYEPGRDHPAVRSAYAARLLERA